MNYILTFNGSAKINLKAPQTLALQNITPFIIYSCCVLCGTSFRDNITEKMSTNVKLKYFNKIDEGRRYLPVKSA